MKLKKVSESQCQALYHISSEPSDIRSVPHLAQLVQDMQGISPLLGPATAVDNGIEDQELRANGHVACLAAMMIKQRWGEISSLLSLLKPDFLIGVHWDWLGICK